MTNNRKLVIINDYSAGTSVPALSVKNADDGIVYESTELRSEYTIPVGSNIVMDPVYGYIPLSFGGAYIEYNNKEEIIPAKVGFNDKYYAKNIQTDIYIYVHSTPFPSKVKDRLITSTVWAGSHLSITDEDGFKYGHGMRIDVLKKVKIACTVDDWYSLDRFTIVNEAQVSYSEPHSVPITVAQSSDNLIITVSTSRIRRQSDVRLITRGNSDESDSSVSVVGDDGKQYALGNCETWVPFGTALCIVCTNPDNKENFGYITQYGKLIFEHKYTEETRFSLEKNLIVTSGDIGGPWPDTYSVTVNIPDSLEIRITDEDNEDYSAQKWLPASMTINISCTAKYGYALSKFTVKYNNTISDYIDGQFSISNLSCDIVIFASSEMVMTKLRVMVTRREYNGSKSDMELFVVDALGNRYSNGNYIKTGTVLDIYCIPKDGSKILGMCVGDTDGVKKLGDPNSHITVSTVNGLLTVSAVSAPNSSPHSEYLVLIEESEGSSVDMYRSESSSDPDSSGIVEYHIKNMEWLQSFCSGFHINFKESDGFTLVDYEIIYGSSVTTYDDTDRMSIYVNGYANGNRPGDVIIRTTTVQGEYRAPAVMLTIKESTGSDVVVKDFDGQEYKNGYSVNKKNTLRVSHSMLPGYDFVSYIISYNGKVFRYNYGDIVFIDHIRTPVTISLMVEPYGAVNIYTAQGYVRHRIFIWTGKKWERFVPYIYTEKGWERCG